MKKLLLIEDRESHRDLVHAILQDTEWSVVDAVNSEQAMFALSEHRIDLILCDLYFARNGFKLADKLSESPATASIPLVACSAVLLLDEGVLCEHGFCGAISKPLSARTFTEQLEAFLVHPNITNIEV